MQRRPFTRSHLHSSRHVQMWKRMRASFYSSHPSKSFRSQCFSFRVVCIVNEERVSLLLHIRCFKMEVNDISINPMSQTSPSSVSSSILQMYWSLVFGGISVSLNYFHLLQCQFSPWIHHLITLFATNSHHHCPSHWMYVRSFSFTFSISNLCQVFLIFQSSPTYHKSVHLTYPSQCFIASRTSTLILILIAQTSSSSPSWPSCKPFLSYGINVVISFVSAICSNLTIRPRKNSISRLDYTCIFIAQSVHPPFHRVMKRCITRSSVFFEFIFTKKTRFFVLFQNHPYQTYLRLWKKTPSTVERVLSCLWCTVTSLLLLVHVIRLVDDSSSVYLSSVLNDVQSSSPLQIDDKNDVIIFW